MTSPPTRTLVARQALVARLRRKPSSHALVARPRRSPRRTPSAALAQPSSQALVASPRRKPSSQALVASRRKPCRKPSSASRSSALVGSAISKASPAVAHVDSHRPKPFRKKPPQQALARDSAQPQGTAATSADLPSRLSAAVRGPLDSPRGELLARHVRMDVLDGQPPDDGREPPEHPVGLVNVVGAAPQRQIDHRCLPPYRVGIDVVKLQEGAFAAAAAAPRDEGTLASITQPDGTLDVSRDVAGPGGCRRDWARLRRRGELPPGDVLQQQLQRPVEDCARITVGDLAPQEFLSASQVLVRFATHRELHAVALR